MSSNSTNFSLNLTLTSSFCFTDEKYFASDVINCKDGSNYFTRDRINDDFCDCVDGTDEPGIFQTLILYYDVNC